MTTWVLILWMHGSGKAIATVPGYESEAACQKAAQMVPNRNSGSSGWLLNEFSGVICIPGPAK